MSTSVRKSAAGCTIGVRNASNDREVCLNGGVVARIFPADHRWTFELLGDGGAWLPTRERWDKRSRAEGAALQAVRAQVTVLRDRLDAAYAKAVAPDPE